MVGVIHTLGENKQLNTLKKKLISSFPSSFSFKMELSISKKTKKRINNFFATTYQPLEQMKWLFATFTEHFIESFLPKLCWNDCLFFYDIPMFAYTK